MKKILRLALGVAICSLFTVADPVLASPNQSGYTRSLDTLITVPDGLNALVRSSVRQQFEQHRHAVIPVDGAHQARNPGQQWQTRFDGRGFITKPDAAGWQWGLELKSYGFAGQERAVNGQSRVSAAGQRVTYDWDETLQEWFVNDRRGLEHGFTVRERPATEPKHSTFNNQQPTSKEAGAALGAECSIFDVECFSNSHPLTFTLAVRGGLRPEVQADGRGVRFVDSQSATALTYTGLAVFDADGRKLSAHFEPVERSRRSNEADSGAQKIEPVRLVTSAATDELRLVIDERGARYPLTIDPIAQQAYLKASNTGAGDAFGWSVAVSGDTLVVGAYEEDSSATGVNGTQTNNSLGRAGAAYVFVREGTNWSQQAYLKASNTGAGDAFGWSVAVLGDTVVVGAPGEASNATGVNGNQTNNTAFASGAVYVFVRSGTNWSQQAYLKASNTGAADEFGISVAMAGDTVVVGAYFEDSSATGVDGNQSDNSADFSGAGYVFVREGTNWSQQAYLKASNTGAGDRFSVSVAVAGDTVVVGAFQEDSNATGVDGNQTNNSFADSGAAYVFVRNGTNWTQQAYLKASNTGAGDFLGRSVAMSGDTVLVGARLEDSNATGVDGDQTNNSFADSGAAYVFVRNGTNWSQQAYLKASNTGASDWFGADVAISGHTVVVGAAGFNQFIEGVGNGEDSNATGVNGNQTNNSAVNSGAAYVFVRDGTNWSQQAYHKASNTGANDYFGKSVAVSGDTVVVGAPGEASNATGVGGNQGNNSAFNSGAAYVFTGLGLGPRLALVPDDTGSHVLRFNGIPYITYRLQRAAGLDGPWETIDTQTAPASGLIEYHETTPLPDAAFYRTVQP